MDMVLVSEYIWGNEWKDENPKDYIFEIKWASKINEDNLIPGIIR